jgi:hypothetical protein
MTAIAVSAIIGSVLGGWGSVVVATLLFAVNAPNADETVRNGYGFNLYTAFVAGGVIGALTAAGVVSRSSDYCIYCGAITVVILLALMPYYSYREFWEGPDLLALPLMLSNGP